MAARLPVFRSVDESGLSGKAHHRFWADLIGRWLYNAGAEFARCCGGRWKERTVQSWMQPQSGKASPLEAADDFLHTLGEVKGQEAIEDVLDALCRRHGGRYQRANDTQHGCLRESISDLIRECNDVAEYAVAELLDGVTIDEAHRIEREVAEAIHALETLLMRARAAVPEDQRPKIRSVS